MKKNKVISCILAAAMVIGMAGCGSTSSSSAAGSAASGSDSAATSTAEVKASSASAAGSSASSADSDVQYIKDKGTLTVGITDFAPMDYKEDGSDEWIGFDADLAKKVAEDLGVDCEFVEINWDNKILELDNKSIDVVWNGMTLTDEVTGSMNCTDPYLRNAQTVILPSDKVDQYKDVDSMKDLNFAVESGSAGEQAAKDNGLTSTAMSSQADALMEVEAGTSDAAIIDLLMAGAMVGEGTSYPDLTTSVELSSEEYGIGCRKGSDLTDYINEEMSKFYKDGSIQELAKKYGVQDALIKQ
ncbi:MAG: transporter substrate-binding domain-containing protein [Lachnospiraceae bacterium]|nr:transporter substrate-binding domain-containing protein [Lachnospiraceae bacterium]